MSVCNLVVQRDAAYLVTDAGYFDADGRIIALLPKSIVIPGVPVVIGCVGSGSIHAEAVIACSERFDRDNFTLSAFRDLVRELYDTKGEDPEANSTLWTAAYYSERLSQAHGFCFFTATLEDAESWRWHAERVRIQPYVPSTEVWGADVRVSLADPNVFNPVTDSMAFVYAQRRFRDWGGVKDHYAVAGEIRLSKVSAAGVEEILLHDFGEQVGDFVKPD